MDESHTLLRTVGVSSDLLDTLVAGARAAGALGAKLTGAGVGGSVVALATAEGTEPVRRALIEAGARSAFAVRIMEEG
jgi:mevalonate kinase